MRDYGEKNRLGSTMSDNCNYFDGKRAQRKREITSNREKNETEREGGRCPLRDSHGVSETSFTYHRADSKFEFKRGLAETRSERNPNLPGFMLEIRRIRDEQKKKGRADEWRDNDSRGATGNRFTR